MSTPEQKAKALAYYYAHRERILERQRERYRNDEEYREYRLKQAKEWFRDNPTQAYHNHREWCRNNNGKVLAWQREWYAKNRAKKLAYNRKWYSENREKILAQKRERRNANA